MPETVTMSGVTTSSGAAGHHVQRTMLADRANLAEHELAAICNNKSETQAIHAWHAASTLKRNLKRQMLVWLERRPTRTGVVRAHFTSSPTVNPSISVSRPCLVSGM